jgi:hypothetical protein
MNKYIWPYGHKLSDIFLDVDRGVINYEYFRPYFDQAGLPLDIAKACLGEHYSQFRVPVQVAFVKFVKLSTLRSKPRIPSYQEISSELVDYGAIPHFKLVGQLRAFGGDDVFSKTPCVFVSHRWQSAEHPDPSGARLGQILERFDAIPRASDTVPPEAYLWIDFCCLPQRVSGPLPAAELERLRDGLARLAEVVKSCDLLVLDSPDYVGRAWCYAELFVWLTKVAEVGFTDNLKDSRIFRSPLSNHLFTGHHDRSDAHHFDQSVVSNLRYRGFGGTERDILAIYRQISDYTHTTIDAANYNMGAFEGEYLPTLIGFMCTVWDALQQKQCTERRDKEVCLRVIVDALKFVGAA